MRKRQAGILLPVFSLPGPYGMGSLGSFAYQFIDALAQANQSIWQILPLCPPGYGGSPYSSQSAQAGNPLFIDLDNLMKRGWIEASQLQGLDWEAQSPYIDYEAVSQSKHQALRYAYATFCTHVSRDSFEQFRASNPWVRDYALFLALSHEFRHKPWQEWPKELSHREPQALARVTADLREEIEFHEFCQWVFETQWNELHDYATGKGIKILGDIPIYVSLDSADTWANPQLFQLGSDFYPEKVAGVPPDGFSATGQIWGNPLYDWPAHQRSDFSWWKERIGRQLQRVDILRIDHFRGLESYFAIPADATSAVAGTWEPGPGIDFFTALEKQLGTLPLVLEDLGYLTPAVEDLRNATGQPGIQLIQFAFDSREPADYWPHEIPKNSVVYTGTHDNDTLQGWFASLAPEDQELARIYCGASHIAIEDMPQCFIARAMTSVADTCIIPAADYLGLDSSARINTPGQMQGNWGWRLSQSDWNAYPWDEIAQLTAISGRAPGTHHTQH